MKRGKMNFGAAEVAGAASVEVVVAAVVSAGAVEFVSDILINFN